METNRGIEISRRIYTRLLHLYPLEHREEYGPQMLQLFTDQLRAAGRESGQRGLVLLWLRTLWDLGINAVKEQFSSPHFTAGLLEAVPNAPLPWKGVALVLVPGLVFFIAQLGQLSGQDWFYLMMYRAGYFLIIPVLLIWAWQRKFPIWGLVPLGLFFRTAWNLGYRIVMGQFVFGNPAWFSRPVLLKAVAISCVLLLIVLLTVIITRHQRVPGRTWLWLGIFVALCLLSVAANYWDYFYNNLYPMELRQFLSDIIPSLLSDSAGLLLLILLGSFFARRHGRLAMLLVVGYLLPTVVYGRFTNFWNSLPAEVVNTYLLLISITVLVYRFIIALAAPIWVVRSASDRAQRKASLVTLLVCVGIQAAMNIGVGIFMALYYQYTGWYWVNWYNTIATQLVAATGIAMAAVLYGSAEPAANTPMWSPSKEIPLPETRQ